MVNAEQYSLHGKPLKLPFNTCLTNSIYRKWASIL